MSKDPPKKRGAGRGELWTKRRRGGKKGKALGRRNPGGGGAVEGQTRGHVAARMSLGESGRSGGEEVSGASGGPGLLPQVRWEPQRAEEGHAQTRVFTGAVWMLWQRVRCQGTRAAIWAVEGVEGVKRAEGTLLQGLRQDSLVNPESTHPTQGSSWERHPGLHNQAWPSVTPHAPLPHPTQVPLSMCKFWEWVNRSSLSINHQLWSIT